MEEHLIRPSRYNRLWLGLSLMAAALVLGAASAWCLLFGCNHFTLEIERIGDETICFEYGTVFEDPGCVVRLRGDRFFQNGLLLASEYETTGKVDPQRVGRYPVEYHAAVFGFQADTWRFVRIVDTQPPVIRLVPDAGTPSVPYWEAGYSAYDNYDGDITERVVRTESVGKITYSVVDSSGNPAVMERSIPAADLLPPELRLVGGSEYTMYCGMPYQEPGFSAVDEFEGDLTPMVQVSCDREIVRYLPGDYSVKYSVSDSSGNWAAAERIVHVVPSPRPVIREPKGRTIYLTFDDGPGPDTARLLDLLKRYQVQATFFVVDTGYPELLRRIVSEGHSIGIHTRTHNYRMIYQSPEAFFSDIFAMQQIIQEETGIETWLMRFPGGSSNTVSHFNQGIMTYLTRAVEDCGFSYFDWNVDSGDAGGAQQPAQIISNIKNGAASNRISVVLQHDIHGCSVDAVESILIWGLNNGYTFLPLQIDSPAIHHSVQN